MFITFEGIDGSGKTSQIQSLRERLEGEGREVLLTREPGGSPGAEEIRKLLLQGSTDRWSAVSEILLFTAARRDHLEKVIWPALESGKTVLCDRFLDSTRAYQGQRGQEELAMVEAIHERVIGFQPDMTLLLDLDPAVALGRSIRRLSAAGSKEDRFENAGLEFQSRLRVAFLQMAAAEPGRFQVIDADGGAAEVSARIWQAVSARLEPIAPILEA